MRHSSLYTFTRPPRTKPQSVTPRSRASSTARLEGAPTATTIGQPAIAAFWTSSKERRPLTQRTPSASGRRPSREGQPMTLSLAVWGPAAPPPEGGTPPPPGEPPARGAPGGREGGGGA